MANLTPREREVLAYLTTGGSNAFIANEMGVSVSTIKFHLKNISKKLGAKNRLQIVMRSDNE